MKTCVGSETDFKFYVQQIIVQDFNVSGSFL